MADTELLTQLRNYSERRMSPFVDPRHFYNELIATAFFKRRQDPRWYEWLIHTRAKFDKELAALLESGKCEKKNTNDIEFLFLPDFFTHAVRSLWTRNSAHLCEPFPDESKIGFPVPRELIRIVTPLDIPKLLARPPEANLPLLRLSLGENGSIIILSSFIKSKLIDVAFAKIRNFLAEPQNRDFCRNALGNLLVNMDSYVDAVLNMLRRETLESVRLLEESDNRIYHFWICMHKCLRMYPEMTSTSFEKAVPVLQAVDIIEIYNRYYHEKTVSELGENSVIREIESQLAKPPYFFSLTMISRFTDKYGKPLTDIMPKDDLSSMLVKRSNTVNSGQLPDILLFGDSRRDRWFVQKNYLFQALMFKLTRLKNSVNESIEHEWSRVMQEYRRTPAMKNEMEFESLIMQKIQEIDPFLLTMYLDNRLVTMKREMVENDALTSLADSFFDGFLVCSLHKLLKLDRRVLLNSIRAGLPFWHSIPVIVALIRLLRGIHD